MNKYYFNSFLLLFIWPLAVWFVFMRMNYLFSARDLLEAFNLFNGVILWQLLLGIINPGLIQSIVSMIFNYLIIGAILIGFNRLFPWIKLAYKYLIVSVAFFILIGFGILYLSSGVWM
jgi:hypothetical protein